MKNLECTRGSTAIDYSYARNSESEYLSVKYAVDLAQKYGLSIHICHLSAKKSLEYLKSLKLKSMNNSNIEITTEITPHHLLLDNSSFDRFGTLVKTNPPLREKGENLTIKSLIDINMIGTDHAPHRIDEKQMGVWNSSPGIPNLETVLPLLLTEVNRGNIDLKMIPKLMSETPAKRFGIENKGKIEVGYDADLVIIDLKEEGKFNIDNFYTKAKYSPFENFNYKGIATMTICNGKIIMNKDNIEYGYNGSNSITNSNSIYLESDNRVKYVYD
nr:dihydroorotase family protein [Methanobrevibacter arboriphilus]